MPRRQPHDPIQAALQAWISTTAITGDDSASLRAELAQTAPRRFTIYEPMALLPSGSFAGAAWTETLAGSTPPARDRLWALLLRELSAVGRRARVTHLAVNEGIPPVLRSRGDDDDVDGKDGEERENMLRSPTGLRVLHGDFGPDGEAAATTPTTEDFDAALWVRTRQNGICQTWAPRWTMFSRGNVKEKARLLRFGDETGGSGSGLQQPWAVDLYAGIGYFVFSYARRGMRVLCWELNPWSVEALRRGAEANGWTVRAVTAAAELALPVEQIVNNDDNDDDDEKKKKTKKKPQIIVFLQDNRQARPALRRLQTLGVVDRVAHVNAGLLPTSEPTWETAWETARRSRGGGAVWLHLHENVGAGEVEARRAEIEARLRRMGCDGAGDGGQACEVVVPHVERVKTFAPGVWHCVFDVRVTAVDGDVT